MKMTIHGEEDTNLLPFINLRILPLMQMYVRSHIKREKLLHFSEEFNLCDFLNTIMRTNFLLCRKVRSDYIIEINPNLYMRNSFAKLSDICNLVNFGNINCQAYPIFSQMISYIKREFYVLYKLYA